MGIELIVNKHFTLSKLSATIIQLKPVDEIGWCAFELLEIFAVHKRMKNTSNNNHSVMKKTIMKCYMYCIYA